MVVDDQRDASTMAFQQIGDEVVIPNSVNDYQIWLKGYFLYFGRRWLECGKVLFTIAAFFAVKKSDCVAALAQKERSMIDILLDASLEASDFTDE